MLLDVVVPPRVVLGALVLVRGAVLFPVVVVTVVPLIQLMPLRVVLMVWMPVLALMQVWMSAPVLSWMSS